MRKRLILFVICCVLFVVSAFASIVTIYNIINFESLNFNKKQAPFETFILREASHDNINRIISILHIQENETEASWSTNSYFKTDLYYEVIDQTTQKIIYHHPDYDEPLNPSQIEGYSSYDFSTQEAVGPLLKNIYAETDKALTLNVGWDTQSDFYQRSEEIHSFLTQNSWLIWANLGWIVLIIVWIYFLVIHGQQTQASWITRTPTEILAIVSGLLMMLLIYAVFASLSWIFRFSINGFQYLFVLLIVASLLLAITINMIVMMLISKIKTKSLIRHSFIGSFLGGFKNFVSLLPQQLSIIGVLLGWLLINLFLLLNMSGSFFVLLFLVFNGFVFYQLLKLSHQYSLFMDHLHKVRNGDITKPLNKDEFKSIFHQPIFDLNNLQDGLQAAVNKSLQDERLSIDLIANVSHDLKTPLTTILNYTQFLIDDVNPEKHHDYLLTIKEKAERLSDLANSVVEASKASSGKEEVNLMSLNALELLNQVLVEHQEPFVNKGLSLLVDETSLDHLVLADSQMLYRVFENLFKNIEKYALDGSRVYIEGFTSQAELEISFKNISKYQLGSQDLTARFVQGDSTRQQEGSGLGLAISKDLMKLMDGSLSLSHDGDLFKVILKLNRAKV